MFRGLQVPPQAKTIPLGQRRKRGRPAKATRAPGQAVKTKRGSPESCHQHVCVCVIIVLLVHFPKNVVGCYGKTNGLGAIVSRTTLVVVREGV